MSEQVRRIEMGWNVLRSPICGAIKPYWVPTLVHQDPGHRNESQGENLRERHLGDFITILVSSLIIFPMMRPFFFWIVIAMWISFSGEKSGF